MKISCRKKCRIQDFFANLRCPSCFSIERAPCPEGEGTCKECECRINVATDMLTGRWE